jgi:hypothetical protein
MERDTSAYDSIAGYSVPDPMVRSVGQGVNDGARKAQGRQGQEGQAEEVALLIYEEVRARFPHLEELP